MSKLCFFTRESSLCLINFKVYDYFGVCGVKVNFGNEESILFHELYQFTPLRLITCSTA